MDVFNGMILQRDEFLEVKCPYCDLFIERLRLRSHLSGHSQMNLMFRWHYTIQDFSQASTLTNGDKSEIDRNIQRTQRFFSVNLSPEEKQRIVKEDIVNFPVLFTDPVYFDKLLSLHHRMKGPLFTHFTKNEKELEFLQESFRPYFFMKMVSQQFVTSSGLLYLFWKCPDCAFKTPHLTFFAAVFLALCHLIKAEVNHRALLHVKLQELICTEWVNFNETFGATFNEKFSIDNGTVQIFDDFLPKAENAEILDSLFNTDMMEKKIFVFCICCLEKIDQAPAFVEHCAEKHKLCQDLTFFSLSKDRVGRVLLNQLTPYWFPLAFVIEENKANGSSQPKLSLLHWVCYECKMHMVETNYLLLLVKALLHFYFELFLPYKEYVLFKRWPELLEFLKNLRKQLGGDAKKMNFLSFDWLQLKPFVHTSEVAKLIASVSGTGKCIRAKNHKVSLCMICEEVFLDPSQPQLEKHLINCAITADPQQSGRMDTSLKHLVMEINRSLTSEAYTVFDSNISSSRDVLKGYERDSFKLIKSKKDQRSKVATVSRIHSKRRKVSLKRMEAE